MGNPTETGAFNPCSKSPVMARRFTNNNKGIASEAGGGNVSLDRKRAREGFAWAYLLRPDTARID